MPGRSADSAKLKFITEQGSSWIDCVFLTCFDSEFQVFAGLLRSSGIRMHHAYTAEQADFLLTATEAPVLLSDTVFLEGTWDDAARMLAHVHPRVAMVIIVDAAERTFWSQDFCRSGHELVSKPLRMSELGRAIRTAAHRG